MLRELPFCRPLPHPPAGGDTGSPAPTSTEPWPSCFYKRWSVSANKGGLLAGEGHCDNLSNSHSGRQCNGTTGQVSTQSPSGRPNPSHRQSMVKTMMKGTGGGSQAGAERGVHLQSGASSLIAHPTPDIRVSFPTVTFRHLLPMVEPMPSARSGNNRSFQVCLENVLFVFFFE